MKKFLLPGILTVFSLFLPSRSQANPLDVPTGGGRVTLSSFTFTPGYFVGKSTFSVAFTTPTAAYQYCINHIAVTAPNSGVFEMWSSTSAITAGTTDYMVQLSSGVPYDTQWSYMNPYCAPQGALFNLFLGVAGSTVTYEGYTFKGLNP